MVKTPRILILSALALTLAGTLGAQEQSLGDVARKSRKGGAKKVLTNEDLPKGGQGISTVGQAPVETAEATTAEASAPEEAAAGTEAGTDAQAAEAGTADAPAADAEITAMEERLKKLQYDEAGLERRIAKMEADMEEAETEFRRETYRTGLENARGNLDNVRTAREQTEKALADARKSNPGSSQPAGPNPQQPAPAENQPE